MIISTYDDTALHKAFGIDMSEISDIGVGAGWGRVAPGCRSDAHQHDEIEVFVIVAGQGELIVDGARHPVGPGAVAKFDPFETHVLENVGGEDVVFATFYWRAAGFAIQAAGRSPRRRFDERPVFVFSTPPTPNGDLHLGHLSGPYLGADAYVRFQRMNGVQAWHLTGSDDYQSYVVGAARRDNCQPAQTAARFSAEIAATLSLMDIELDQYTVTDQDPTYRDGLRSFFSRLVDSGWVAPLRAPALFHPDTGAYLYEVDVAGGCPGCGEGTSGNICEECGEPNTCVDLVNPVSQPEGRAPRFGEVTRYSLPLHEFRDDVAAHHRLGRVPARLRELAERVFTRRPFDLSITHPSSWGVPPAENDVTDQVIWVWPEMSYGFLHGIEVLGQRLNQPWRADHPAPDWKIVHFFGYDNSFYHAMLYPVLYQLAFPQWKPDIDYHLNEFYLLDEGKFSTSRRHGIWGKEILGPDTVDAVRFYLCRTRPEGRRTNFERAAYQNEVRRTLIGTWQRWLDDVGRRVAERFNGAAPDAGTWTPEQIAFLARLDGRRTALTGCLGQDGFSLNQAAEELDGIVADALRLTRMDGPIAGIARWCDESRTTLALELAAARLLAHAAAPVMPRFAAKLAEALGLETPREWPQTIELVPAGNKIDLAGRVFFTEPLLASPTISATGASTATEPAEESLKGMGQAVGWLDEQVRQLLRLPADAPLAGRSLSALGMTSLQIMTLQYQILERFEQDVPIEDLTRVDDLAGLARLLSRQRAVSAGRPA